MYTLSFADYFLSLFPNVNAKLISFIVLTALFGMHFFGVKVQQDYRISYVQYLQLQLQRILYLELGMYREIILQMDS